ncbi:MAG: DEAD/DEAH box helicase, partial [Bacteroidota bacterium]
FLVGYETLRQDITESQLSPPRRRQWDIVVLDEAQKIKNRDADVSRRIKMLPRRKAWALTGTPLENRIDELASILEFTRPMELDGQLVHVYAGSKMHELHQRMQLRRKKAEVLPQLPPKLVSTVPLSLDGHQRVAYDLAERDGILDLQGKGDTVRIENVLELITRLKQICNFAPADGQSAKFDDLRDRLTTLVAEGHKAIVYSQYVDDRYGVGRIARLLAYFRPLIYTGQLDAQEKNLVVERFKTDPNRQVLVLSLRAGGLGLNLQEATYVFHFDRWWNPAVELQAEVEFVGQRALRERLRIRVQDNQLRAAEARTVNLRRDVSAAAAETEDFDGELLFDRSRCGDGGFSR